MPFIHDEEDSASSTTGEILPQTQSPFFSLLPGELRNQIYALAMTADKPIIDPSLPPTSTAFAQAMYYRTEHHRVPNLSTELLRTCKRMYNEIPITTLYGCNTFRFTTWFGAHRFLTALGKENSALIEDVEIDLRGVNNTQPVVEREWVQYLSWTPHPNPSLWTVKIGSLHAVTPNLKTLRLNIENWHVQETMRSIALLKEMLAGPKDLQSVIMTGVDGSELLFGSRERYLAKWGPVAFVGVMRFARLAGMVDWLAACVEGEKEDKVVVWAKIGRKVNLEIMTARMYRSVTGRRAEALDSRAVFDLEKGECHLTDYEKRWHSGEWPNEP
jgi:hypothetical protein